MNASRSWSSTLLPSFESTRLVADSGEIYNPPIKHLKSQVDKTMLAQLTEIVQTKDANKPND